MVNMNNGVSPASLNMGGVFEEWLLGNLSQIVENAVKKAIEDKKYENVVLDQNLTHKQLCDRWHISKNTLLSWVDKGIIKPIKLGRKNVYSLKDVREAEADGLIKNRA